jgi:hypothetical protein
MSEMSLAKLGQMLSQTWPARAGMSALEALRLPGDVYQGNVSMYGEDGRTNPEVIGRSSDLAGLVMGGAAPLASNVSRAGEVSLGIVPVDVGKAFMKPNLPDSDMFRTAVKNTQGARVEDGSLVMPITRNQRPEQAMDESVRGGVFYLPQGSKDAKFYTGTKENFAYGGTDKIAGETAINNPLFVKGATGGKAPEAAYDQLLGKGAYQAMRTDAINSAPYYFKANEKSEFVGAFLRKYAPEMEDLADHILANSTKGNQLAYALQEAAVASAARKAGHDAVLGYSVSRKTKEPNISEVYDVRESHYPNRAGDYQTWPADMFGKK